MKIIQRTILLAIALSAFATFWSSAAAQSADIHRVAYFSRVTDTISIAGNTDLTTAATIEARVFFGSDAVSWGNIFNEWANIQEDKRIEAGPDSFRAYGYPVNVGSAIGVDQPLAANRWHHVAYVFDGGEERLYIDGVQAAARPASGSIGNSSGNPFIGAIFRDGEIRPGFIGYIDFLRVSNVVRYTGPNIAVPTGPVATDADTELLYDFNETPGSTTLTDLSGHGRHGTLGVGFTGATAPEFIAAPGAGGLDLTFGPAHTGKVTAAIGGGDDFGGRVATQSDGKIVVGGSAGGGSTSQDFALAKFNVDGSLDTSFGGTGKVVTDIRGAPDIIQGLAIQPDGKIVAVGLSDTTNDDIAVVRYKPDGSLDTTFGTQGVVITTIGTSHEAATGVIIQSDGKILVAGVVELGGSHDFALLRYNTNGSPDADFGTDGKVITDFGGTDDAGLNLALQSDGKIVMTGYSTLAGVHRIATARYLENGSPDPSFNGTGQVTTVVGGVDDVGWSVAVQSNGKIVVAGHAGNGTDKDFAVVRYNENGSLDTSFHTTGMLTTAIGSGDDIAYAMTIQADGKILAAGHAWNGMNHDFALVRYLANGNLDPSFNATGKVTTPIGPGDDIGTGIVLDSAGRIVVGGSSFNGTNYDFALVRYLATVTPAQMVVLQPADTALVSGATRDFGTTILGHPVDLTFTIRNPGSQDLTGVTVTKDSDPDGAFSIVTLPDPLIIGLIGETTLTVRLAPASSGAKTAMLHVSSTALSNTFDIALTGRVLSPADDTDSDGLNDAAEFKLTALGFDWQVSQTALVSAFLTDARLFTQTQIDASRQAGRDDVTNAPNTYGLYTLSQMQTLHVDAPLLSRDPLTGRFKLTIALKKSANLIQFDPFSFTDPGTTINTQGNLEFEFTVPDSATFFRLEAQ